MAPRRIGVIEDPNDPRYGEYIYDDSNADEQGNMPTDRDYQPPDSSQNSTPVSPIDPTFDYVNAQTGHESEPYTQPGTTPQAQPSQPSSGGNQATPAPAQAPVVQQPPSMPWSGAPAPTVTAPQSQTGAQDSRYREMIMQLLNTPQDVNADALMSSPENRAFRLSQQRAEERQRAQMAEQASAEGWSDSGAFDSELAGLRQQRGEGEAAFVGQLAVTKMQANREQLVQGIQFAMADRQFDLAQDLQRQLANVDAALRRAQIGESARQFDLGLGFDYTQLQTNANQRATELAMGY